MRRLFVSQELLDVWTAEGKIELAGSVLRITEENREFQLAPGVRFVSLAAGEDQARLVGKVKTEPQLGTLGAELYMNSVLLGEAAYDVEPGFLTELSDGAALGALAPPPAKSLAPAAFEATHVGKAQPGAEAAKPEGGPATAADAEREALAKFLLENLN
ncbi:MAG: hypothetical protein ACYCWW_03110 [Deltaproteobacteria bacterium]